MRCLEVEGLVDAYVDGTLEETRAADLERHAQGCARCTEALVSARALRRALQGMAPARAPQGFAARVMDAVYRETLTGAPGAAAAAERAPAGRAAAPARAWRRLGYSFMVSAAVLAVSLLVPRAAYPTLVGAPVAAVTRDGGSAAQGALAGADRAMRGVLGETTTGGGGTR
jgi:anti-sigma factor RsiW